MGYPRNDSSETNFSMRLAAIHSQGESSRNNSVTGGAYQTGSTAEGFVDEVSNISLSGITNRLKTLPANNVKFSDWHYLNDKNDTPAMQYIPYFDWYATNNTGATVSNVDGSMGVQFWDQYQAIPVVTTAQTIWTAGLANMISTTPVTNGSVVKSITRQAYNESTADPEYRWPTRSQSGSFIYMQDDGVPSGFDAQLTYTQSLNYSNGGAETGFVYRPESVMAVETVYYFKPKFGGTNYRAFGWRDDYMWSSTGWETDPAILAVYHKSAVYKPQSGSGVKSITITFSPQTWSATTNLSASETADVQNLAHQFDPDSGAWCFPETTIGNEQPSGTGYEDKLAFHFGVGIKQTMTNVSWTGNGFSRASSGSDQIAETWEIYYDGESQPSWY